VMDVTSILTVYACDQGENVLVCAVAWNLKSVLWVQGLY